MPDLETLHAFHLTACEAVDDIKRLLQEAQEEEALAEGNKLDAYNEAFVNGLVITDVVDPDGITYYAGERETLNSVFGLEEDDRVHLNPDQSHVDSMRGRMAIRASVHRHFSESPDEAADRASDGIIEVSFAIPGMYQNQTDEARGIYRPDDEITRYSGRLTAIAWRLPTDSEIQAVSSLTALAELH
jgi:hypothetical protein